MADYRRWSALLICGLIALIPLFGVFPGSTPRDTVSLVLFRRRVNETGSGAWSEACLDVNHRLHVKVEQRLVRAHRYREQMSEAAATILNSPPPIKLVAINEDGGRLGNFMFRAATLIGIARKYNHLPVTLISDPRTSFFSGLAVQTLSKSDALKLTQQTDIPIVAEFSANIYSTDIGDFPSRFGNQSVLLNGYLQSWKYFDSFRDEIQSALTFTLAIYSAALNSIKNGLEIRRTPCTSAVRLVGVHVRRTDMLIPFSRALGYVGATNAYLVGTLRLVQKKYPDSVFFILTDDVPYCRNLAIDWDNAVIVEGNSAEVDMALLSLMDVVVMTVGSFGWWGAYLSGADEVFYYRNWPRRHSELANRTHRGDYFLPNWQGRV